MIELHLKHHTTGIIVNPGFGSIYSSRIALRQVRSYVLKHLFERFSKMFKADFVNNLGIENITAHAWYSSLTRYTAVHRRKRFKNDDGKHTRSVLLIAGELGTNR